MKLLSMNEKHGIIKKYFNTQLPNQPSKHEPSFPLCRVTNVEIQPQGPIEKDNKTPIALFVHY